MFLHAFYSEAVGWSYFTFQEAGFFDAEHDAGIPEADAPSTPLLGGNSLDTGPVYLHLKTPYTRTFRGQMAHETKEGLQQALDNLGAMFGSKGRLYRHRLTHGFQWVPARLVALPLTINHASLYRHKHYYTLDIEARFQIYESLWSGNYHGERLVLPGGGPLEVLGASLVLGYDPAEDTHPLGTAFTTNNRGTRGLTSVRIIITATGTIPSLTLTNSTSGTQWTYNGGLVNGDVLEVDTKEQSVTKNGTPALFDNAFVRRFTWTKDVWMGIARGVNNLNTNAGPGTIALHYYDAYA